LTEKEIARAGAQAGGVGEGEAGLPSREPDAGLDPRTLGPRPGRRADAQQLSHPVYRAFSCRSLSKMSVAWI